MTRETRQQLRTNDSQQIIDLKNSKGRYAIPVFWFFILALLTPILSAQSNQINKLGQTYLQGAQSALQAGNAEIALTHVNRGLEIDSSNSDLLHLRSIIKTRYLVSAADAMSDSQNAVHLNRWKSYSRESGYIQLSTILSYMHRWVEVIQSLDSAIDASSLLKVPQLIAIKCQAYFELGNKNQAEALLSQALKIHPDNVWIMSMAIHYRQIPNTVAFLWFNRFESKEPAYLQALFWYFHQLEPGAEMLKRCQQYLSAGGTDPWAFADGMRANQTQPNYSPAIEKNWLQGFLQNQGPVDLDVAQAFAANLLDSGNKDALNAFLNAQELKASRDYDRDGWYEEQLVFAAGQIQKWHWNPHQDDLSDLTLYFKSGQPSIALQKLPSMTIRLDYGEYPEVVSSWLVSPTSIRELIMPHRMEEIRLIDLPDGGINKTLDALQCLTIPNGPLQLNPTKLQAAAWLVNEYQTQEPHRVISQSRQVNGIIVSQRIDSNANGRFDSLYWYENGQKQIGFRDVQENGDFSIVEFYDKGKPLQYSFVSLNDGISFSIVGPGKVAWDLNHDNRLNRKELIAGNAWLTQEFSPQNDQNFNGEYLEKRYKRSWIFF